MGGRLATCPDTCEVGEGEEADTELLGEGDEVRAGLRLGPGPRHGQPQEAGHHQRLQWSGIRNMVSDDTRETRDTKPNLHSIIPLLGCREKKHCIYYFSFMTNLQLR